MRDIEVLCSKCNLPMDRGFVPDSVSYASRQSTWFEGAPKVRLLRGGIKRPTASGLPIVTYRCTRCGLLESYAHEQGSLAR
jgi:hypothetical protein